MPSSEPRETIIETFLILPSVFSIKLLLRLHAARRLGITGDLRCLLDRAVRKQRVEVLGRDSADFVHAPHPGHNPLFLEVFANEVEDPPMGIRQGDAEFL